ncbi:MAG TPA: DUF885 domain-containing protein, partial [Labilithrix sp.]|nr:DUF885 domain-containing protein [Labilithrix sp.]
VKQELESRLGRERNAEVLADLKILVASVDRAIRRSQLEEDKQVPFLNVAEHVFGGVRSLLDDRVVPARRQAAVARLSAYVGKNGGRPLTVFAREETSAALSDKKRTAPSKMMVEKALQNSSVLTDGIEKLFQKYAVVGYEPALAEYKKQLGEYDAWLKTELLPRSRADFRLAPEIYAMQLEWAGVDLAPQQIAELGHKGFAEIRSELETVAGAVARERKLPKADYRDVIRELKKEQIADSEILPLYEKTLAALETVIEREHLVTLPKRAAKIRLATKAESAKSPAPHLDPPRLIGNSGEPGEFVLPLSIPPAPGKKETKLDDFSFTAATWTLTAHEARPGHELQFTSMVESKVSTARAVFAFNSANVEGWGLYSEYITRPFMPTEGQAISLVYRLHRAARAFLDPELHMGKITPQAAREFLVKEVGLSEAFANSEVERYTFHMPGQATAYFYGLTRLLETRKAVEERLGAKFDVQKFNDFVLSKGLMPPSLLREAALAELR